MDPVASYFALEPVDSNPVPVLVPVYPLPRLLPKGQRSGLEDTLVSRRHVGVGVCRGR